MFPIIRCFALLVFATLCGCASFQTKLAKLDNKMDEEKVKEALGNPTTTQRLGDDEYLFYEDGAAILRDGKYSHGLLPTGTNYKVSINAFRGDELRGKHFIIIPLDPKVSALDLEFKEYSSEVSRMLSEKGYLPSDAAHADLAITLSYAITDPQVSIEHVPVYGQLTAGKTITTDSSGSATASAYGSNGNSAYGYSNSNGSSTTYVPPTYGVIGSRRVKHVEYGRIVSISALDFKYFKEKNAVKTYWQESVFSAGASGDLRAVMPAMLSAASNYVGKSSDGVINAVISNSDPRIAEIRNTSRMPASAH